jgi:hypothetical protein
VVGHFEARVVLPGTAHCPATAPFCTAGRVWGGIQGTVFLNGGDQFQGTDTGSIDLVRGGFASLITLDGEGGQIRLRGDLNAAENTTSGDYLGTYCR